MKTRVYEVGPIRPPSEAYSLLLRITRNCPWNRCKFCHIYQGTKFSLRSVEEVKTDIDAIKEIADSLKQASWRMGNGGEITYNLVSAIQHGRLPEFHDSSCLQVALWLNQRGKNVFLQDANSLVMKTPELAEILNYLKETFPEIERITSYARSQTLSRKSVEELKLLRKAGLTRIHVGMESGSDAVLKLIRKGMTTEQHITGGKNVKLGGMELSEYIMPGVGGVELSDDHARESARVINAINPDFIRLRSFVPIPGTPIARDIEEDLITPLTEDGVVKEIRLFITELDGITSRLVSDHIMNLLEEVEGDFPREKDAMLSIIDAYLKLPDDERKLYKVGRRVGMFRNLNDRLNPLNKVKVESVIQSLEQRFGDVDTGLKMILRQYI